MKKVFLLVFIIGMMLIPLFTSPSPVGVKDEPFLSLSEYGLFSSRYILKYKENLAISLVQEKKIEDRMTIYKESVIRDTSEIKVKEFELAGIIKAENVDRVGIEKLIREISAKKTTLLINRLNYLLDIRDILSPEQVKKGIVLINKRKDN